MRPTVLAGGGSLLVSWLLQLEEPLGRLLVPGQASVALGSGALLLAAASLALATDLPGRSGRGHDAPRASAPDSADFVISIGFDDLAGLQAYLRHPAHGELATRFYRSLTSALIYDFEMDGRLVGENR